jgi:radical SAM/Cys-rich protein
MTTNFEQKLAQSHVDLTPVSVQTLQVNLTKMCNQACHHCHVDSSPKRTEEMSLELIKTCLQVLKDNPAMTTLDLTGGAPELNPHFRYFVEEARKLGKKVIVRHNLTVTFDGHPTSGEKLLDLPQFFARNQVEVVSSLPYYEEYFTDRQRGTGVFKKSIRGLQLLNQEGYGKSGSGLVLNLVYNPVGPFLPAAQADLEARYKESLLKNYQIVFNSLFAITNMPIKRFEDSLKKSGQYQSYMEKLSTAFNPVAAAGVMCRSMVSIDHEGNLYDCDFNQMLELKVSGFVRHIREFSLNSFLKRKIVTGPHCFGCTAGAGSSCGGELA